jgi:hypothetical protein
LKQIKWKKGRENREKKKRNPPIGQNSLFLWTFLKGEKCWTILTFYNTKKNKAMRKPPNLKQIKWKKGRENREKKKKKPTNRPKPPFLWTFLKAEKCWTILTFYNTKKKNKAMQNRHVLLLDCSFEEPARQARFAQKNNSLLFRKLDDITQK